MTDNVEFRLRFSQILEEAADHFATLIGDPSPDPVRRGIRIGARLAGPLPDPWRRRMALGRTMGQSLVRAAQLKVAAEMAGNEELAGAASERMKSILDDDWCPTRPKVIKLPKGPFPPDPGPRPDELTVNWQDFELLVSTMVDYQAGLQDGALKEEIGGLIKDIVQ